MYKDHLLIKTALQGPKSAVLTVIHLSIKTAFFGPLGGLISP